jgi:threonyl-tRNA synthetase
MADNELEQVLGKKPYTPLMALRHSAAHVLADAVKRLFPTAKLTIGPPIDTGFYYDFDMETPFTEEDLGKLEGLMGEIVKANHEFRVQEITREYAISYFTERNEPYKVEMARELPEGERITLHSHGEFTDLCRGGHCKTTGEIKAFKLLSVAGAYWRGKEGNPMLQRIYGTAFPTQEELAQHLERIEEAKRRDHRVVGKALDLFSIDETIGGGLVLWHPKGARVRYLAEEFWRQEHFKNGYDVVYSPHVARDELWHTSGHLSFYKENMYSGMDVDGQQYLVKPMNCPFHCTMFKHGLRSYRELPLRWAELGTVYRYERSGALHGLLRVRGFTQDDAHIFMRRDQLAEELLRTLNFCLHILKSFGFTDFKLYLATRPEKDYVGELDAWKEAEQYLFDALKTTGYEYEIDHGGGAFYGPKIDLKLRDALGREWQCSTIQVDFNLPERFKLDYVGQDGAKHRVVMVHRALFGSLERFMAVLIEHYAGAFPLWLAPVQVRILTISEKAEAWAREVQKTLSDRGFRVDSDLSPDKIGPKIARAGTEKVPVALVVGPRDAEGKTVAPRLREGNKQLGTQSVEDFANWLAQQAAVPHGLPQA